MSRENPALSAFLDSLETERLWAQLLVQRQGTGFLLRHVADRDASLDSLRGIAVSDLRKISTFSAAGQFRPVRAAPDLGSGWVCQCTTVQELWRALQELYPGSVADWFAAQTDRPPVTNYRAFAGRQSGMYRITQLLTDERAAQVITACCHPRFCLKRRLWSVEGLAVDSLEGKSAIPCLEACAVLLELARKAARIEQEEKISVQLSRSELGSFVAAARALLERGGTGEGVANPGELTNPRRLQLLLEKFGGEADRVENTEEE